MDESGVAAVSGSWLQTRGSASPPPRPAWDSVYVEAVLAEEDGRPFCLATGQVSLPGWPPRRVSPADGGRGCRRLPLLLTSSVLHCSLAASGSAAASR